VKITPSRINTLLTIGENLNTEFKRAGDGPKADTFESVCAFLNKAGGDLLLGVDDDGTVVGLPPKSVDAMIRNFVKVMNDPNLFEPVFDEDDVFRLTVPLDDAYSADRERSARLW
jgi:predicted HTH transcriptional regulator